MPDFFLDHDLDFALAGHAACSRALGAMIASKPFPLPGDKPHYARDLTLHCPTCGRAYVYVPDAETLEERSGPRQGAPA